MLLVHILPSSLRAQNQALDPLLETGKSFYKVRDLDSAYHYFNLAVAADSASDEAYFRRGLVREKMNDTEGALADYAAAVRINPKPVYYNNRGMIFTLREDHLAALEEYDKALALDPDYVQALFNKGIAYHHLGMTEEACRFVGKARDKGFELAENYWQQFCR